jgi:hypothetical protein
MKVEIVSLDDLVEPSWHATYILRPDMVTLAASIGAYGMLSPLIVHRGTNVVIDGTQRLKLLRGNLHLGKMFKDGVPVNYVDCDELDAMALHVQINRGRGLPLAKGVSNIVRMLFKSKKFSQDDFVKYFAMKYDELELMLDGTIIKHRDIANYNYSRAWVPVEAPPGTIEKAPVAIESPPNADR